VTHPTARDRLPPGPILVVADNAAIARSAVDWSRRFAALGRLHRVRLAGRGDAEDVAAIAAEAVSLGSVAIMAAGDRTVVGLAARVAEALNLPLTEAVNWATPGG
jgi:hypothetical protein